MRIKGVRRKSKWHSPTFNLSGINRETLSLILCHAKSDIEAEHQKGVSEAVRGVNESILRVVNDIDSYINDPDDCRRLVAEEIRD